MADSNAIPGSYSEPLLRTPDGRLVWTGEWWRFLRELSAQPQLTADQSAAIAALAERVAALEDGGSDASIQGLLSVIISGTLADGLVQVALAGDEALPAPSSYYGTDDTGAKGFHAFPVFDNTVPFAIPDGETYTVFVNKQALFTLPIELDGDASLVVDGALVEVD